MYLKFFLCALLFLATFAKAQDTIRHTDGYSIEYYYKNRIPRKGYDYDTSFQRLMQEWHHKRFTNTTLYIIYHSDSSYTRGKKRRRVYKWGKWKTYDKRGKLVKIEKFKYNKRHGTQIDLTTHERRRYKYGVSNDELCNAKGQKYVFWFTAGMPTFRNLGCEEERYACQLLPIAGCVIIKGTFRDMAIHNTMVYVRQSLRFGFGWKKKFWQGVDCNTEHQSFGF